MTKLDTLSLQVNEELLNFQRKRRFMEVAAGENAPAISASETTVLLLIDGNEDLSIRDVSNALDIEHSWMSRIISAMEERGYIKTTIPERDRRSRVLKLTPSGKKTLAEALSFQTSLIEECLKILTSAEQKEIVLFVRKMVDALSAPKLVGHEEAHPLAIELSRLTRSFRLHADNYLGTGYSLTEIQALAAIDASGDKPFSIKNLDGLFPLDLSSLSRLVTKLEASKVITKEKSPQDKRAFLLALTGDGRRALNRYFDEMKARFKLALRDTSEEEISNFLRLMRNVNQSQFSRDPKEDKNQLALKELGASEIDTLKNPWRNFVNQSKRSNDSGKVLGVYSNKTMLGVINVDSKISLLLNDMTAENLKQITEACAK